MTNSWPSSSYILPLFILSSLFWGSSYVYPKHFRVFYTSIMLSSVFFSRFWTVCFWFGYFLLPCFPFCLVFHLSSGISNELLMSSFMYFTYRISVWPFLWEIPIFWNPSSFIFSNIFLMYSLGTELNWGWVSVLIRLCPPVICPQCWSVVTQGRGFQVRVSYAHFP